MVGSSLGGKVDRRVVVGEDGEGLRLRLRRRPPSVRAKPLPRREKGRRRNDEVACTGGACALERATTQDVEGEPPLAGCRGTEAEVVGVATVTVEATRQADWPA